VALKKVNWRRYAPLGLYLAVLALLVAFGLFVIQREWNFSLQVSLALVIVGLALYVLMDPVRIQEFFVGRQARQGSNALVMTLAFAGIIFVVNYLGFQNSQRWDLTEDQEHTLASETLATLEVIAEPVTALAFFTANTPADQARQLLDDFHYFSQGIITIEFIDPNEDPVSARRENINRDGTIVFQLGDRKEQITLVSEGEITGALIRLLNPGNRVVYFLTGHGERDPQGVGDLSLNMVQTTLQNKNYGVATLNLLAGNQIPKDATVIVIAGPQQPVSENEVSLLRAYLDGGGALIVMQDPRIVTDFGDSPDPLAEYMAQEWGIGLGEDIVVDLTSNQPFTAFTNRYNTHLITQRMQGLVSFFPDTRSVQVDARVDGINQVELAFTAEQSWAEIDLEAVESGEEIAPDDGVDLIGPVSLAVAAETLQGRTRLVVFGDSDFATNVRFSAFGNGDLIINAIDWAAGQEELINLSPNPPTERRLRITPQTTLLNLIVFLSVVVLPGIVVLSGVAVWIQRRRRD
jgi:ABC-type uncharacterized transport system involved in gliding motility auxiliary subunit